MTNRNGTLIHINAISVVGPGHGWPRLSLPANSGLSTIVTSKSSTIPLDRSPCTRPHGNTCNNRDTGANRTRVCHTAGPGRVSSQSHLVHSLNFHSYHNV